MNKQVEKVEYWSKLKSLPCIVTKEQGRLEGDYSLRISASSGVWFLEYIYDGELFTGCEEACYPFRCSGATLEEVVDKATKFFSDNFGKYKLENY